MNDKLIFWLQDRFMDCVINGWKVLLLGVLAGAVAVFCLMFDERYQ